MVYDPSRIAHSLKVALAITLVSMVYFLEPFYNGMGDAGMWAIITVVVVFEYTVGATLSKGLNRGFATLLAGVLGVGADTFASQFGPTVEPVVLGLLVFLIVATATFSRFIPSINKRYDYGIQIFMVTFVFVSISGYRVDKIIELAHRRLKAIVFGGATCVLINMCICPVWAGERLHKLLVTNLEELARFLEGFGDEYYRIPDCDKSFLTAYKSVLNSGATGEESLANYAWWEIGHGKFRFRHPWKKYLKIAVYTRQCAYHIEALTGYLEAKYKVPSEFQKTIKEPCMKMSTEVGKALKELGSSMKLMVYPSSFAIHLKNCKNAVDELNTSLKVSMVAECDTLEAIPVFAATSILIEIVKCVETISEAIEELSELARFKKLKNITSDRIEKPHFLNSASPTKPITIGKDEELITITILLGGRIPQESDPDEANDNNDNNHTPNTPAEQCYR